MSAHQELRKDGIQLLNLRMFLAEKRYFSELWTFHVLPVSYYPDFDPDPDLDFDLDNAT